MFLNTRLLKQFLATLYIIMRNWTQVSVQSSWRGWTSKYVTDVLLLLDWGQGPSVRLLVGYSSATPSSALTCCLPNLTLASDSHRVRAGLVFTSCSGLSPRCGSCPMTCSDGAHLLAGKASPLRTSRFSGSLEGTPTCPMSRHTRIKR